MRTGPRNPRLAALSYSLLAPLIERFYSHKGFVAPESAYARARIAAIRDKLARGEPAYLVGIGVAGNHNSGVALVEVTREGGPRLICNNEEERFSGRKHTTAFPRLAIAAMLATLDEMGVRADQIDAWVSTWDYALQAASWIRTALEEAPASLNLLFPPATDSFDPGDMRASLDAPRTLARQLGLGERVPIIRMRHHDNHAWYSYCASPFARDAQPAIVAVLDGMGDGSAISLYRAENGAMRPLHANGSLFDSLGFFYSFISSTQGGWTMLSSEGRYMGAAAYGDNDRLTNPYYGPLREIFHLAPNGSVLINRALANWAAKPYTEPYTVALTRILGEPIAAKDMWNPDSMLRVEEIHHSPITQQRLDKAAATQMVFEDALFHIVGHAIRETGSDRLVLTGGVALNALGNMRLLEHFGASYYRRQLGKRTRLHLWVPPTPGDAGVAIGAAYMLAGLAGAGAGAPITHAFYCGNAPSAAEIRTCLDAAPDVAWHALGDVATPTARERIADLMAFVTAQYGVIALMQGPAETGPRALGHRSILANPCNPDTRQVLNDRVKYREAIRPLAPMLTRDAALRFFELSDGAADDDYNAYNYMVLTAQAKAEARIAIPAVIHADGTGRLQIVREETDPLTHAYLKALGRRIGVEVAVNTSFNVAGPIVQTAEQAIATLRRSKGLDVVVMVAADATVFALWLRDAADGGRFRNWLDRWHAEADASAPAK